MIGQRGIVCWVMVIGLCCAGAEVGAAPAIKVSDVHLQLAERHIQAGHPFQAVQSYRRALETGARDPNIHRNLARLLYDTGFVDQAIVEMEQAVAKALPKDFLSMELGVFYLAGGRLELARAAFSRVLELNPGFSSGYYYLGEVLYRLGDYAGANCALVMANQLGMPGFDLQRKLEDLGWQRSIAPWREDSAVFHLRLISVAQRAIAEDILQRLADGELFEDLARRFSTAEQASAGGYVGAIASADLPADFAERVRTLRSFDPPLLLENGQDFSIVQRIAPFQAVIWPQRAAAAAAATAEVDAHSQAPAIGTERYFVMAGAFHNRAYAWQRVQRLRELGCDSWIQTHGNADTARYDVVAERCDSFLQAQAISLKLEAVGLESYVRTVKEPALLQAPQ